MRIERAQDFGRVAVVMGGTGPEREVSLEGGRAVTAALAERGVNAVAVDGTPALLERIGAGAVDRVFNLLHGRGGEDGTLQGALKCLAVPVTGSGVLGSALSMDKDLSKRVWRDLGLATADHVLLTPGEDAHAAVRALGLPVVVKPVSEGSSVGISLVREQAQLPAAVELALRHERRIMIEQLIAGRELTVGILKERELPAIAIETRREFYDYQAKYLDDDTRYLIPCGLSEAEEAALKATARAAFEALRLSGWARIDFIRDAEGRNLLLEANTTPGMTSHSLVPKAAAAIGIDFPALVWQILETSFEEPV